MTEVPLYKSGWVVKRQRFQIGSAAGQIGPPRGRFARLGTDRPASE